MPATQYILTLSCPDRPGIVAGVATLLFQEKCNIVDAQQFDAALTDRFFMRVVFDKAADGYEALRTKFAALAQDFAMDWTMRARAQKRRVMLLVSKFDHCLADILYRWRIGELDMEPCAIVANYPRETYAHIDFDGVPFHYLPVARETKMEQEAEIWRLVRESHTDVVVLARYMQVLSDGLAAKLAGRCINIHHSFLPGFKGAKPYTQAFNRGVKLIGATAHYVTSDLDEGPIIAQAVEPTNHVDQPDVMTAKGRDTEARVLARAVKLHTEGRIFLNGARTVVFE